jgi:hypothetical protein
VARNESLFLDLVDSGVLGITGLFDRKLLPPRREHVGYASAQVNDVKVASAVGKIDEIHNLNLACIRHYRIRVHRAQPDGEHRPHRLGTLGEAPQPACPRGGNA